MDIQHNKKQHPDSNVAYHIEWGFSKNAILWEGSTPLLINFHPIASEYYDWLLRKGQFGIFTESDKDSSDAVTNPYTYSASAISAILADIINSTHNFATSTDDIDKMDAEIERIRLYNEQVLYTARFCEVLIKQLLYCTLIPHRLYKRAALGGLLSHDCKPCRKAGTPHKISFLGSLAHRYHLCLPFEHCLIEHIKIVNRRRNVEAAHSEAQTMNIRSPQESRDQLMRDSLAAGKELTHMLSHIRDLEQEMIKDLNILSKKPYESWR